ncbi:serpin family protein [Acetobacterium bakii]|uniref:Serpin domain-containing protein n=1 Tax=Acetobacterium bakii TaxID=52689 RepID=A0A0L6U0C9_9FIRM|nr:serpin family protein [Acetobacterium bakii]KNZ41797.1 hypothetical protein AKG39_09200 [Acetobacterium bakii]
MKLKKSLIGGLLTACLLLSGCENFSQNTATVPKPEDGILNSFSAPLAARNNDFGFQLYKELNSFDENSMVSPVSIAMALAMTYNGARGETGTAMAETLKIQGVDIETLNRNNLALLYLLSTADPKTTLSIANSLWIGQDVALDPEFVTKVKEFYNATARELDFGDAKAAAVINAWVKKNTQGLIAEIVAPPIDPYAKMFLINAVYFKGEWTHPFKKDLTSDQIFMTEGNQSVTVPMMYQSGSFDYLRGQGFQALRLPYGEEQRLAMYLFLPDENSSLEQFQANLSQENWANWLSLFEKKQGSLLLPKFTMAYETSLNQVLKNMGMGIAFEADTADFTGMIAEGSNEGLHISEVKHKTFIQVDELGTEAAGATSVEMGVTSVPEYDFTLEFNRPFFYAIQDSDTGAILFMGSVADPSK